MDKFGDHLVVNDDSSEDSFDLDLDQSGNLSTGEKVQGISPYLFEPEDSSSEDEEDESDSNDDDVNLPEEISSLAVSVKSRIGGNLCWCQCGGCVPMEREKDCLCCREVSKISSEMLKGKFM